MYVFICLTSACGQRSPQGLWDPRTGRCKRWWLKRTLEV